MAGAAAIRHGLAGNTRTLKQQCQRIGEQFRLARTGSHTKGRKTVALHRLVTLDQLVRRMAFALQFDGSVGKIATGGLAVQTVSSVLDPGKQLAARVARVCGFEIAPDLLGFFGGAAQCLADQLILGAEMPVERHLVGGSRIRNGIDANASNAALTEKLRRCRDDTFPGRDSII